MRKELCLALAKYSGQVLTREVARDMLADLFPDRTIDPAQFGSQRCGSVTFQAELLRDIIPQMHALHQLHWSETEGHRHGLQLDMDYDALLDEERAGTMVQFTARDGDKLVGNFRLYLRVSRHTCTPFAKEDTLYLMPQYRRGRTALRQLEFAKVALMSIGYREFRADVKRTSPAAGRLLEHCGFQAVATEYVLIMPKE